MRQAQLHNGKARNSQCGSLEPPRRNRWDHTAPSKIRLQQIHTHSQTVRLAKRFICKKNHSHRLDGGTWWRALPARTRRGSPCAPGASASSIAHDPLEGRALSGTEQAEVERRDTEEVQAGMGTEGGSARRTRGTKGAEVRPAHPVPEVLHMNLRYLRPDIHFDAGSRR